MDTSRREALDLLRKSVARGVDEQNLPDNPLLKDVIRRLLTEQGQGAPEQFPPAAG